MAWGVEQSIRLITLTVFVLWEMYDSFSHDTGGHYKSAARHYQIPIYVKARYFPFIWGFVKACVIASSFLYMEYTVSTAQDFPYTAVFALFFANILMAKMWMPLFFRLHWYTGALVNSILLCATAWAIFGIAISGMNLRPDLYLAPALVWLPYPLWLTFAVFLNWQWASAKYSHMRSGQPAYNYRRLLSQ